MRYVVFLVALSASLPAFADDKTTLPPLGTWNNAKGQPDTVLDLTMDKSSGAVDSKGRALPPKKEEKVPYLGLSITRPFGNDR